MRICTIDPEKQADSSDNDPTKDGSMPTSELQHDPVLTADEVAIELRCSKAHVYNAINGKVSGVTRLPAITMGRRRLVRRRSLERWKRENEGGKLAASQTTDAAAA